MTPRKGDRYIYPAADGTPAVFIEVTRSSPAGWVDIKCCTWAVVWTKRMPIGLAPDMKRYDWDKGDIDAQHEREAGR